MGPFFKKAQYQAAELAERQLYLRGFPLPAQRLAEPKISYSTAEPERMPTPGSKTCKTERMPLTVNQRILPAEPERTSPPPYPERIST
ncbi:hypothetical protein TNIN_171621 [Trichonephila inaurata madagascariensis]|uniref:Uncharacterized protein n=1 Tax=Trichonephila inaurata madagascariensis TaxID=2747483 RepID=A0A8X6JQF8_9ARAC|nr:hypothetical protein TNIN_171621 [Trichonephila inaurata madagascariensis]